MTLRIVAIVPARGGSKGIPRKNIRPLAGRPLLEYTATAALAARGLTRVVLSTDDAEIAEIGRRCGLDVPFMRPAELARDDTPSLPVVQHAMRWLEDHGETYDAVCLLEPTSPFRRAADIDACIELLVKTGADAVASVLPVPHVYNPHWVFFRDPEGLLHLSTGEAAIIPRRQLLPPAFHRDGSVYVTRRDVLLVQNSLYGKRLVGYPIPPEFSHDLNTEEDWRLAEERLRQAPVDGR